MKIMEDNTDKSDIASPGYILASEIDPEPMEWLWNPYIPAGEVTMLIGDGGLGKSLLMMDIASRITRGVRTFFHVRNTLGVKKIKVDGRTMLKLP